MGDDGHSSHVRAPQGVSLQRPGGAEEGLHAAHSPPRGVRE